MTKPEELKRLILDWGDEQGKTSWDAIEAAIDEAFEPAQQPAEGAEPVAWTARGKDGKPKFGAGWIFSKVQNETANMPLYAAPAPLPRAVDAGHVEPDEEAIEEAYQEAVIRNLVKSRYDFATGARWAFSRAVDAAEPLCACKDRPASECDEEWGPNCDLGNNEKHVRVSPVDPADIDAALRAEPGATSPAAVGGVQARIESAHALLSILREYPDFDAGGALPEAIDQWLAGKTPDMVEALDRLATPPQAEASARVQPLTESQDCPHAAPFRYCSACVVDPCPIGLGEKK